MNELLKRRPAGASKVGASSAVSKVALDALLTEMARPGVGTTYDREYQTGGNPFANSRDEDVAVVVKNDPSKTSKIDFLTDKVDGHDRVIAPGAHDVSVRSESTQNALDAEQAKDDHGYGLTRPKYSSFDFEFDRDRKIARKIASSRFLKQFVDPTNVKVGRDTLVLNIPRGKFAQLEFGPTLASRMEREITASLGIYAKYAHTVLSAGFDGVSLEFVMV